MKVHLLSVESPLPITGTLSADCGAVVKDAAAVAVWDSQSMGAKLEIPPNVCRKCVKEAKSQRYTFGIVESRQLKQEAELYITGGEL